MGNLVNISQPLFLAQANSSASLPFSNRSSGGVSINMRRGTAGYRFRML